MRKPIQGIAAGLAIAAIAAVIVVASSAGAPSPAQGLGVQWRSMSVDAALAEARASEQRVFVKFDAEWCTYCEHLEDEVLSTAEGGRLTEQLVPVRVDFDDEANRPMIERYVVLGLPTVLVLTPDGTQVGRIQGYHGRQEWVDEFEHARTAVDPVPALRDALQTSPGDAEATLRLGEALLVRGSPTEGQALLERVTWMNADEQAAKALFILGRYHHRVRREPEIARHLWRELAARYPDNDWAGGAWWWYAKAQAELGQHDVGLHALRARALAAPHNLSALSQWGDFVATHELAAHRAEPLRLLSTAVPAAPADERTELTELVDKLEGLTEP